MRYHAEPFSQLFRKARQPGETMHETLYAVWDNKIGNFVIESNGLVCVCADRKPVRIWAKYLNDNLPYAGEGRTIENIVMALEP